MITVKRDKHDADIFQITLSDEDLREPVYRTICDIVRDELDTDESLHGVTLRGDWTVTFTALCEIAREGELGEREMYLRESGIRGTI